MGNNKRKKGKGSRKLLKGSGSGVWPRSTDTPGKRSREKGNQNSATPLGDGTTEGQSLGKAVLGSAMEERLRGTTELFQSCGSKTSLYSTKT